MPFTADAINSTIIKEMLTDGRISFTDIAKSCGTSKDVVAKRYKQMELRGIICGSTVHVSPRFLGGNIVTLLLISTEQKNSNEIIRQALKIPQVVAIYPIGLNPNLATLVVAAKAQELHNAKQVLKAIPSISDLETHTITRMRNNPDNLSILGNNHRELKESLFTYEKGADTELDQLDRLIINKLLVNARLPFSRIASELKVATTTIIKRYERLKRNGDLKVVTQINPSKLGYPYYAMITLNFSQTTPKLIDTLAELPDVNFVQQTTGKMDYVLSTLVRNLEQVISLKDYLSCMAGIANIGINIERAFPAWPLPKEFTLIK